MRKSCFLKQGGTFMDNMEPATLDLKQGSWRTSAMSGNSEALYEALACQDLWRLKISSMVEKDGVRALSGRKMKLEL